MTVKRTQFILSLLLIPLFASSLNGSISQAKMDIIKQVAADFSIQDVDSGSTYSLSDFWGKVVVLDFFATWCTPCQVSLPYLKEIYSDYSEDKVQIISIDIDNSESIASVSQFREDENMDWIVGIDTDGSISSDYVETSIPVFYIIDKQGNIEWSETGFDPNETWPVMESTIKNLLKDTQGTSVVAKVFLIILEVSAGLAAAVAVIFAVYKLRNRLGIKKCIKCNGTANVTCSKCSAFICSNCSVNGCPNCGSKKFIRL